ncbi:MAG TPA: helix-turn-helix transcriptional regulator [Polyangiaceae bacterium]|nr:helix-turn-helix transcriptional regulator [Polyangiaceae bacterium]
MEHRCSSFRKLLRALLGAVTREDPAALLKNIGLRIAELRGKRGWSREALAERLGVSVRYVGRLETGGQNLTVHRLAWLAGPLGVRVADLFAAPGIDRIRVGRPARK